MTTKQTRELFQAEKDRAAIAKMRGELVRADDVEAATAHLLRQLRDRVLQIPETLEREHNLTSEQGLAVETTLETILADLARDLTTINAPEDGPTDAD